MSVTMDDSIKRWTTKRKTALVVEIFQGKTTASGRGPTRPGAPPPLASEGIDSLLRDPPSLPSVPVMSFMASSVPCCSGAFTP